MPGTLIVKPIEGKFNKNLDFLTKMDPYCTVFVGSQKAKGQVCKRGGKNPRWNDSISILRAADEPTMYVELKDKDTFTSDDLIGVCKVDLNSIPNQTPVTNWFLVYNKKEMAGQVLLEITYQSNNAYQGTTGGGFVQPGFNQGAYTQPAYNQPNYAQPNYNQTQYAIPSGGQNIGQQIPTPHHHHNVAPNQGTSYGHHAGGHVGAIHDTTAGHTATGHHGC